MSSTIQSIDESLNSSFYEQLVEHKFISELLQEACFRYKSTIEIMRSEVDAYGYDLVIEYKGFIRHIQLKTSKPDSTTKKQSISLKLTQKKNWCVVWIKRNEHLSEEYRIGLDYLFFGTTKNESPYLVNYKKTMKTHKLTPNLRLPREGHRVVRETEFYPRDTRNMDMNELFKLLFP